MGLLRIVFKIETSFSVSFSFVSKFGICVCVYIIIMNSKINMGCFVRVCFIRIGYITRAICLSYKFSVVNVIDSGFA